MEYIFGTKGRIEVLKTKGDAHTDLIGYQETIRSYPNEVITDHYRIVRKLESSEDQDNNCYDWYEIDHHYREVNRSKILKEANDRNSANIDYISMMAGIELPENEMEGDVNE